MQSTTFEYAGFDVLDSSEPLELIHKGSIRRAPNYAKELEIECFFRPVDSAAPEILTKWLPFARFGLYPDATIFDGPRIHHASLLSTHQISGLSNVEEDWIADGDLLKTKLGERFFGETEGFTDMRRIFLDNNRDPPVFVTAIEIARFYLAAASLVADDLLLVDHKLDKVLKTLCNPSRSGQLDDQTFRVAPKFGYLSKSCALQTALLLACPDILSFWQNTMLRLRSFHAQKKRLDVAQWFPAKQPDIVAELNPTSFNDKRTGETFDILSVSNICGDKRELPFTQLIIELPFGVSSEIIGDLDDSNDDDERAQRHGLSILEKYLGRTDYLKPSLRRKTLLAARRSLYQNFPALDGVNVEITRKRTFLGSTTISRKKYQKILDSIGLGKSKSAGTAAGVRHVMDGGQRDQEKFEPDYGQMLAPEFASKPAELIEVAIDALNPRLVSFLSAGQQLTETGAIANESSSLTGSAADLVTVMVFPKSWGSWAYLPRTGKGRMAAFLPIIADDTLVWAIEIQQTHKDEKFALGLLCDFHGRDGLDFLNAYLFSMAQRLASPQRKDGLDGPFPPGIFADVAVSRLVHTLARTKSRRLKSALENKASSMVRELRQTPIEHIDL
jgi:hypothetical protein